MPKDILQVGPLQGEGLLLACAQVLQAGALERSGVDEDGLLSVIRRDEAEAFLVVLELYGARGHGLSFHCRHARGMRRAGCAVSGSAIWKRLKRAGRQ